MMKTMRREAPPPVKGKGTAVTVPVKAAPAKEESEDDDDEEDDSEVGHHHSSPSLEGPYGQSRGGVRGGDEDSEEEMDWGSSPSEERWLPGMVKCKEESE